jgi:hypothetical protein
LCLAGVIFLVPATSFFSGSLSPVTLAFSGSPAAATRVFVCPLTPGGLFFFCARGPAELVLPAVTLVFAGVPVLWALFFAGWLMAATLVFSGPPMLLLNLLFAGPPMEAVLFTDTPPMAPCSGLIAAEAWVTGMVTQAPHTAGTRRIRRIIERFSFA